MQYYLFCSCAVGILSDQSVLAHPNILMDISHSLQISMWFQFFLKKNYLIHFEWIFEEIRDKNPIKFLCWIVYQHQLLKRPHFCTVSFCILCQILCMLSFLVSFLGPLPYSCILICFLCVYQAVYMTIAIRCNNKNNTHVVNFSILSVSDHSFPEGK